MHKSTNHFRKSRNRDHLPPLELVNFAQWREGRAAGSDSIDVSAKRTSTMSLSSAALIKPLGNTRKQEPPHAAPLCFSKFRSPKAIGILHPLKSIKIPHQKWPTLDDFGVPHPPSSIAEHQHLVLRSEPWAWVAAVTCWCLASQDQHLLAAAETSRRLSP